MNPPTDAGEPESAPNQPAAGTQARRSSAQAVLLLATLLLLMLILLRRFERQLPQWLAGHPPKADSVLVEKAARRLSLIRDDTVYGSWRISLGLDPKGHKQREGDHRTPEGWSILDRRNPNSCCYRSLHVSYPNE